MYLITTVFLASEIGSQYYDFFSLFVNGFLSISNPPNSAESCMAAALLLLEPLE